MATPVEGVYLAGVIASGNDANRLFIENARGHGELIVGDICSQPTGSRARGSAGHWLTVTQSSCSIAIRYPTAASSR